MFVVRNARKSSVPGHHNECELKEMFEKLWTLPVHSTMEKKCRENHRVHGEAWVAAGEWQTHFFKFSCRRFLVSASKIFDITLEVYRIRTVGTVGHDWLANADEMRPQAPDRIFCNVSSELTASSAEQKNSEILVAVLHPKRNCSSKQFHLSLWIHAAFPPNNFSDEYCDDWNTKANNIENCTRDSRLVEWML